MNKQTFLIFAMLLCTASVFAQNKVRVKENFDFDWKFILNDNPAYAGKHYADTGWSDIQLPHDWSIRLHFERSAGGSAGFLPGGVGWYRKSFTLPASGKGKMISVLFDGIFHQSDVYINGHHLGFRPYGFCSLEYDLTPYLNFNEENVLSVRVDRTGEGARWYTGSGIYRHVWLRMTNPVHVSTGGTCITTPSIAKEKADIKIVTTLVNSGEQAATLSLSHRILDAEGKEVARSGKRKTVIRAGSSADVEQIFPLTNPQLWSIEHPAMYRMETIVEDGRKIVDVCTTPFGIRSIRFDRDKGFFLNGRQVKLKGMCLHQDAGSLGSAVPDRADERRLEILKEYGCNAIRCAHNQPSPEFLDICDRLGFVVIDEAFDKWKSGYYAKYFDEWWRKDLENMLLRDRNHPCVILWSIGNELQEAWGDPHESSPAAAMLQEFVHRFEPTRPVILSVQNNHREEFAGVTDVIGYNYLEARLLGDRKKFPERIFIVTEELPYFSGEEGNIRSYTPYNPWNIVAAHDFIAGGFIWSGVDYLGEAVWPSKGWPNGLFDICMNEKPRAAYHRAMWNPEPLVRIAVMDPSLDIDHGRDLWQWPKMASHWNFPDRYIGQIMEIRTITNCEEVELFLNGKSVGSRRTADFANHTIVWYLPYIYGKLEAKGYNGNREVAACALVTSKKTAKAVIKADKPELRADGQDLSHLSIHLEDEDGNPVQTDDRMLTVTVEGEGRFLGIDNGDLRRQNSFAGKSLSTYFGKALLVVQSSRKAGKINVSIKMEGEDTPYTVDIQSK
jgi:beta-galactosidase